METGQKTKEELAATYSSPEWRVSFLRLLGINSILRDSIISSNYKIPDNLNNSIYLTAKGSSIAQDLKTKHEVPYKEAKLLCFLVMAYREPLVDVEKTNYAVLIDEVSKQIQSGELKHPFVFGRLLYDKAADLFSDSRRYLSVQDTSRLLEGTPAGVWQVDNLVTGPFGILRSRENRAFEPYTQIPLQHCADLSCSKVHYVQLTTDGEAPVNLNRYKLNRLLEKGKHEPSDWNGFITDLVKVEENKLYEDNFNSASLIYLLGDGLDDVELRRLVGSLLDNTQGTLREVAGEVGKTGSAEDITASLDRAQLLQLILCAQDVDIVRNLDDLVTENRIDVPGGEVRKARVNKAERLGPWGLSAELGHRGLRFYSLDTGLPMLRLKRLITSLYKTDVFEDMQELDWQLRSVEGMTAGSKLAEYIRFEAPEKVLYNLVLARRENAEAACRIIKVSPDPGRSDDNLIACLMWKLGFTSRDVETPHGRFFSRQDEVIRLTRAADLSAIVDEEPIRKAASVYFQDLEYLLTDCLSYATWALLTDHYSNERPYVYRPSMDTSPAMALLNEASAAQSASDQRVIFSDMNTVRPLSEGFRILARYLEKLPENASNHVRDAESAPDYISRTDLKQFPFIHTYPFLDLDPEARSSIVKGLKEISQLLLSQNMPEMRNSLIHFRRTTVDISKVMLALESVRSSVQLIDGLGFLRVPFVHIMTMADEWGRQAITLMAPEGQRVVFTRPSAYDRLGLPNLTEEQYLMHSAVFAEPNEVLRFRLGHDSLYQNMWTNYPRRRTAGDSSVANQSETEQGSVNPVGRSNVRTG